tara:strand:- start:145 stop:441 length:297 start_codon:yes stop_codon:yes gene_type:complete
MTYEELQKKALDDLVDAIMRGEDFPQNAHKWNQVNLSDMLRCSEKDDLIYLILAAKNKDVYEFFDDLRNDVRRFFKDTAWQTIMMQKIIDEAAEDENE